MSKRHEQLLFHYSSALARGDFDAVADVLREAEHDPTLEQMILDMNDAYAVERFNHTNPKEIPMLAALYQNPYRTPKSRVHWQSLPFVAALVVMALLSVMLAVQTRGSTPLNTGGDDSSAVAQTSPYCSGVLTSTFTTVPLRSRPASDAPVVTELVHDNNAGREIVVLDRATADGEAWVFVRVPSSPDVPFGWITEAEFSTMVADCLPLVDGIAPRPLLVVTDDAPAPVVPSVITATPLPIMAQEPLFVVTQPSADTLVTVVPADAIPLVTFTATPIPFVFEPSPIAATIVPSAAEYGVSIAATDLARFDDGGACKATTLATADILSLPSWEGEVITTLSRNTVISVGDYTMSTDSNGNPLVWYAVGVDDVRGWTLAALLDMSACPFSAAPFTNVEATPVPFSAEPTVIPPLLVPATSTPIPTPTLIP